MSTTVKRQIQAAMFMTHRPTLKLNDRAAAWRTKGLRSR